MPVRITVLWRGTCAHIDGVSVSPDDVIVADATGIVVVPCADAERVAELAERYAADDRNAESVIRNGLSSSRVMAKFKRI